MKPARPTLSDLHAAALARLERAPDPYSIAFEDKGRAPPVPRWYAPGAEPWNLKPRPPGRTLNVCPLCGQRDTQSPAAHWHPECVSLWKVGGNQSLVVFSMNDVCELTGERIGAKRYEVDHRIPLFEVRRVLLEDVPGRWRRGWAYWSVFNLRPVLEAAHRKHSANQRRRQGDLFA